MKRCSDSIGVDRRHWHSITLVADLNSHHRDPAKLDGLGQMMAYRWSPEWWKATISRGLSVSRSRIYFAGTMIHRKHQESILQPRGMQEIVLWSSKWRLKARYGAVCSIEFWSCSSNYVQGCSQLWLLTSFGHEVPEKESKEKTCNRGQSQLTFSQQSSATWKISRGQLVGLSRR